MEEHESVTRVEAISREIETLPWYVQERALETLKGIEQDVRFRSLGDLTPSDKQRLTELLTVSYERSIQYEQEMER